jgi:multidrug transporter EmrE-like cation transporter
MGATASCLAKFALSPESPLHRVYEVCIDYSEQQEPHNLCLVVEWIPRLICLVVMIVMNAMMLGAFLSGMEESGSIAATGLATAANFGTSAIFGIWLWNERVNEVWLAGFTLVICGVLLLSQVRAVDDKKKSA